MLHFTTRDIITRARELADLENSNFITWAENMKLLDESYKKLYQEAINVNDKYYLTRCELKDLVVAERREKEVAFYLPADFYQLQSISVKGSGRQILKKAKTEDSSSARYDIINDTLVLYGGSASLPLEIAYYPVPKTLTLKNDTKTFAIDGKILDCNDNNYLILDEDEDEDKVIIYNINTGASEEFDISSITETITSAILGKTCAVLYTENNRYFLRIKEKTVTLDNDSEIIYGKKDNIIVLFNIPQAEGDTLSLMDEFFRFYYDLKKPVDYELDVLGYYFTIDDDGNYYFMRDVGNPIFSSLTGFNKDGETINIIEDVKTNTKFQFINNNLFFVKGDVYKGDEVLVKATDFYSCIGFNKEDYDTGYGVTCSNIDNDDISVHSCFNDTELDFPNNFYFSYLAYLMAIAYKQKQNADASMLIQRANDEYAQFLTSISRDVAENNRIQNVYNGGNYYYG